jgi:hypothetical protein
MLVFNPFPDLVALERVRCHWGSRETMNSCKIQKFLGALIVIAILSACSVPAELAPSATTPIASDEMGDIIAKYRREIPRLMEQENIPGLAIAVVDGQGFAIEIIDDIEGSERPTRSQTVVHEIDRPTAIRCFRYGQWQWRAAG